MDERTILFIGVAIYIAIMAAVAVYSSRRSGSATDFVLAGRGLSLGLCTTTIIATWFGGGLLMGGSGAWITTLLYYPDLPGDLVGLGVSLTAMLVVTPLTQKWDPPRELRDRDGKTVELTDRLGILH